MSQITDTGPSIAVVNERNGRRTPLATIEDQMEKTGQMDVSKSSSIMDTVSELEFLVCGLAEATVFFHMQIILFSTVLAVLHIYPPPPHTHAHTV